MSKNYTIYNVPETIFSRQPLKKNKKYIKKSNKPVSVVIVNKQRKFYPLLPFINELKRVKFYKFIDHGDSIQCAYYVSTPTHLRKKDGSNPFLMQMQMLMCRNCGNYIDGYIADNPQCNTSKHLYCSC
jgi:hypothetical protein